MAPLPQAEDEMTHTVLLVDDEPAIRDLGSMMLEDCGCKVVTAASGSSALATLNQHPEISLLLTDVQMPGMDGYELARRAVAVRPDLAVVIMSGTDCGSTGFPFVRKPISFEQLETIFKSACH
jgi:two-component system cell cycle response regulator CpdR